MGWTDYLSGRYSRSASLDCTRLNVSKINARGFLVLYWGAQLLAFLPNIWLTPQEAHSLWAYGAWVTLLMCGAFGFHALWVWRQVKLAVDPVAATNPKISGLLMRTQTIGGASLVGLFTVAAINVALGDGANSWLDAVMGVALLGVLVSSGLAARCLCKAEIEITPQAKPSVFGTFVLFFYAGLTAGAIARRSRKAVTAAGAQPLSVNVA